MNKIYTGREVTVHRNIFLRNLFLYFIRVGGMKVATQVKTTTVLGMLTSTAIKKLEF